MRRRRRRRRRRSGMRESGSRKMLIAIGRRWRMLTLMPHDDIVMSEHRWSKTAIRIPDLKECSLPSIWMAIRWVQIPDVFSMAKSLWRAILGVVGVWGAVEAVEKVARCSTWYTWNGGDAAMMAIAWPALVADDWPFRWGWRMDGLSFFWHKICTWYNYQRV